MLNLPNTSAALLVVTGSAVASIAVHASFNDLSIPSTTVIAGAQNTLIGAMGSTVVVASPPAAFDRNVKFLSVLNTSGSPCVVTIQQTDDGVLFLPLFSITLLGGYAIHYSTDADGFVVYDTSGRRLLGSS